MAAAADLPYLIRLLDDKDPLVRPVVRDAAGRRRLSRVLAEGRRRTLRDEWLMPTRGAAALADDWEGFENFLRQVSDFLHDGITLRPSMSDALDALAGEIASELVSPSEDDVRRWLFVDDRFRGLPRKADASRYFDLCRVIESRRGNPTSLACMFMLLGRRLDLRVHGCNYPGHFLARILTGGEPHLVDCFHRGRTFNIDALLRAHPEISNHAKSAVNDSGHLGFVLLRYLAELERSLGGEGRTEDALLFKDLAATLKP